MWIATWPAAPATLKKLQPPRAGFRLRCGDYCVVLDLKDESTIEITGVRNRKDAHR